MTVESFSITGCRLQGSFHVMKFGPRPPGQSESIIRIATKLAREANATILDGYLSSVKSCMSGGIERIDSTAGR